MEKETRYVGVRETLAYGFANAGQDLANKMESFIQADKKELEEKCEVSKHNNEELLSPRSWCEDMVKLYERILDKAE